MHISRSHHCFVFFALVWLCLFAASAHADDAPPISNPNIIAAVNASAPVGWTLSWEVPTHLLDGSFPSGASEGSSVEFQDPEGNNKATALILKTACSASNPNGVYPHDYRRCSSIHGRELRDLSTIQLGAGWYHQLYMVKHAINEHEISLIVVDKVSSYRVDSKLISTNYTPACDGQVYNFQIWSDSPALTQSIVSSITNFLAAIKPLVYSNNTAPVTPPGLITVANYNSNTLHLALSSVVSGPANITVVAWTYPIPTPNVSTFPTTLNGGLQTLSLPLNPQDALATELEVYFTPQGAIPDTILESVNHFGHYTSNWIPFAGPASSVGIGGVNGGPPNINPTFTEFTLNDSTLSLDCNLSGASYCGIFMDLIPEIEDFTISFGAFDQVVFFAKRGSTSTLNTFDLKLEASSGMHYQHTFVADTNWRQYKIPLKDFSGPLGEPWSPEADIERITLAAVAPGGPSMQASLKLSSMQVTRPPRIDLTVIGNGSVEVRPINKTCENSCSFLVPRGEQISLRPRAAPQSVFLKWSGRCAPCKTLKLQADTACVAIFAPKASLTHQGPTSTAAKQSQSDHTLHNLHTCIDEDIPTTQSHL